MNMIVRYYVVPLWGQKEASLATKNLMGAHYAAPLFLQKKSTIWIALVIAWVAGYEVRLLQGETISEWYKNMV